MPLAVFNLSQFPGVRPDPVEHRRRKPACESILLAGVEGTKKPSLPHRGRHSHLVAGPMLERAC